MDNHYYTRQQLDMLSRIDYKIGHLTDHMPVGIKTWARGVLDDAKTTSIVMRGSVTGKVVIFRAFTHAAILGDDQPIAALANQTVEVMLSKIVGAVCGQYIEDKTQLEELEAALNEMHESYIDKLVARTKE